MGEVLSGTNAVWEFQPDAVVIRYSRGVRGSRLLQALGERRVPHEALAGAELTEGRRGTLLLRALPRPGADPLIEVADGQLRESADPYRIVLPDQARERAETSLAALLAAINAAAPTEPPTRFLVPAPAAPRSFKAYDAKATFDGRAITFHWFRTGASTAKWNSGDQTFPVENLTGIQWRSPDQIHGHLRLLPRNPTPHRNSTAHRHPDPLAPDLDPATVLFGLGYGSVHESLPFAAAVLSAIRTPRKP